MHNDYTWTISEDKIEEMKQLAILKHGEAGDTYDGKPYEYHLEDVVAEVIRHGGDARHQVVAWGHDLKEDTDVTDQEIFDKFGSNVNHCLDLLNSEGIEGPRILKHLDAFYKLRTDPVALFVKLCDRKSNMKRSKGTHYLGMYVKEYVPFKFALFNGENLDLWECLDELFLEGGGTFERYNR